LAEIEELKGIEQDQNDQEVGQDDGARDGSPKSIDIFGPPKEEFNG